MTAANSKPSEALPIHGVLRCGKMRFRPKIQVAAPTASIAAGEGSGM